ncbi:SH3 domain-containing protein [Vibrio rhizosphaerae]|uniref:SH3 domain-containing protein n=1 Tax=Vibrio rhizosphaerae TaxID=398736 RepID=A0ABU4IXH1_9VIBR|nr:SH3 domain-containing protein [Vibrio rhizosphaerae]MDW6094102.1 SH3 domain-containing protein [Vibrio rhizosphaerae]
MKIIMLCCLGLSFTLTAQANSCLKGQACYQVQKNAHQSSAQKMSRKKLYRGAGHYVVTAKRLNVRGDNLLDGRPVGQLAYGENIYVYRFSQGWAMIQFRNEVAWVSGRYLKYQPYNF